VRVCKLYDVILYILDWTEEWLSILFELCRSYICKLTLYGYIFADYFICTQAKMYPAKELEHGLRPK
jgi:hypothetical protein